MTYRDDPIRKIQQPSNFPVALFLLFASGSLLSGTGPPIKYPKGYTGGVSMAFISKQSNWWVYPWLVPDCHVETLDFSPSLQTATSPQQFGPIRNTPPLHK